jgi:predicted lipase
VPSDISPNTELLKMLAEFANDVYGPLQYTDDRMDTAPILNLKKMLAVDALKNEAKKVVQREGSYLQGYRIVDSIVCGSGVMGTEQYFGCLMYKKSELDVYLKIALEEAGPNFPKVKSIIKYSKANDLDQLKAEIKQRWGQRKEADDVLKGIDKCNWDRRIVIAFRGTKKIKDWMSNLDAIRAPFKWGQVHSGFLNIYNSGRVGLMKGVDGLIPKDKRMAQQTHILVTGHSLGGALATLCAAELSDRPEVARPVCYTFASPRVGDDAFAAGYKGAVAIWANEILQSKCSVRVYRPMDIVPKIPKLGFKHVPYKFELSGIDSSGSGGGILPGGAPHGMAKYRELIQADPMDDGQVDPQAKDEE